MTLVGAGLVAAVAPASAATIDAGDWYVVVNRNSGKVLDIAGASTADAAVVDQWSRTNATNQQFRFESAGTGYWRIIARHSGKALDLWEWNVADGAEYRQWPITSGYNQQFSVQTIDGYVQFINRTSGKALEVWEWSTADGARISQYTDTDGANQQWQLVKVATGSGGGTTATTTSSSSGGGSTGSWPSATGSVKVDATIAVSGTFDGGGKRYYGIGDGGQSESQDPMFEVAAGGTVKNVIIGAPAGDGIHCLGSCTISNVWWEDVGEDAATFLGTSSSMSAVVDGGGARSATDKVFQHNGAGTVTIRNFQVSDFGKLYRGCGNCTNHYTRNVVLSNVTVTAPAEAVVGINSNWGDTARITNLTILNDPSKKLVICQKYTGVAKGSEPSKNGVGPDSTNCLYSASNVTYK